MTVDIKASASEWKVFQDLFGPALVSLMHKAGHRVRFKYADGVVSIDVSPL
jgi:hypothetical protein